jgi:hypothetical protein
VEERVTADYRTERARSLASEAGAAALERLRAGVSVAGIAADTGREWTRADAMQRTERRAPAAVVRAAFDAPRPDATSGRSLAEVVLPDGAFVIVAVTAVRPGDLGAMTEEELDAFRVRTQAGLGGTDFEAFRAGLRRDLGVKRLAPPSLGGEGV